MAAATITDVIISLSLPSLPGLWYMRDYVHATRQSHFSTCPAPLSWCPSLACTFSFNSNSKCPGSPLLLTSPNLPSLTIGVSKGLLGGACQHPCSNQSQVAATLPKMPRHRIPGGSSGHPGQPSESHLTRIALPNTQKPPCGSHTCIAARHGSRGLVKRGRGCGACKNLSTSADCGKKLAVYPLSPGCLRDLAVCFCLRP